MTAKVVDASALAAIAFREAQLSAMTQRLAGHELHAPTLLRFEMANVCIKKIRLQPIQRDALILQHRQSLGVLVQEHTVDQLGVMDLADRLSLSAYEASYLWLARELGVELVTLDERLAKAAAKP